MGTIHSGTEAMGNIKLLQMNGKLFAARRTCDEI